MMELRGRTALVTGASGGIGPRIAQALGKEGMNVVASGRREDVLGGVVDELRRLGVRAEAVPADLADPSVADTLIERSEAALGPVDVLVNNAGIEITAAFTRYTREELNSMVSVNLSAPMLITHRVLPDMLSRGRGHIVFISSIAGKIAPAYEAPYGATKAGLIALTQSLRAEYPRGPVGFSVICPGFVAGDGMYQRMVELGHTSNRVMSSTTTEKVAERVVEAIRRDLPEVIESGSPLRPILAISQLAPRLTERAVPRIGLTKLFRDAATSRGRAG
jgi:short-subunit dehydrogenase